MSRADKTANADRRAFLGSSIALASVVAASAVPAAASEDLDADLLALREPWQTTLRACNDLYPLTDAIERRCFARYPAYPDHATWPGDFASYSAEHTRVSAVRQAIRLEEGEAEADRLVAEASDAHATVLEQIEAIPARTLRGLVFKVEVSADWEHDKPELIESIMSDIIAMGAHADVA